jgi:hypothetical protein
LLARSNNGPAHRPSGRNLTGPERETSIEA